MHTPSRGRFRGRCTRCAQVIRKRLSTQGLKDTLTCLGAHSGPRGRRGTSWPRSALQHARAPAKLQLVLLDVQKLLHLLQREACSCSSVLTNKHPHAPLTRPGLRFNDIMRKRCYHPLSLPRTSPGQNPANR